MGDPIAIPFFGLKIGHCIENNSAELLFLEAV